MSRAEPVPGPAGPQHCPLGFQYKFWETLDTIFKCLRNCFSHQQSDASSGNPSPAARPPTLAQTMSQHRSHGPLRFYSQPLCNLVPPTSTVCIRQGLAANRTGANRAYQTAHIVSPSSPVKHTGQVRRRKCAAGMQRMSPTKGWKMYPTYQIHKNTTATYAK